MRWDTVFFCMSVTGTGVTLFYRPSGSPIFKVPATLYLTQNFSAQYVFKLLQSCSHTYGISSCYGYTQYCTYLMCDIIIYIQYAKLFSKIIAQMLPT